MKNTSGYRWLLTLLLLCWFLTGCVAQDDGSGARQIYDGETISNMQYTAAEYAKGLLEEKLDQPYSIEMTSTAVRATFDGIFLVTFDYSAGDTSDLKYSYLVSVAENMDCTLLDWGEAMDLYDLIREA